MKCADCACEADRLGRLDYCDSLKCCCDEEPRCVCGHPKEEHHTSWFRGGGELVDECEMYGSNQAGGMRWDEETETWEDHCHKYKQAEV